MRLSIVKESSCPEQIKILVVKIKVLKNMGEIVGNIK